MNGPLTGWRVLLRIAWRDVLRNKGRSALILVMIALPVLGVTAAHVVISTQNVSTLEGLDRRLGNAEANLEVTTNEAVGQETDPHRGGWSSGYRKEPVTTADLTEILGKNAVLTPWRQDWLNARLDDRVRNVTVTSADLREDVFDGTYELTAGRLPEKKGEILVNEALSDRGVTMGETLEFLDSPGTLEVVGLAEDASYRGSEHAWAFPGSVAAPVQGPVAEPDDYLVTGADVGWAQVVELNKLGVNVLSRSVVTDPPSDDEIRAAQGENYYDDNTSEMVFAAIVLVITMALLEVILLAGPAFAVGARRMQRHLAQVAATGGTPGQVRRAVLATAVVLGGIAAAVGLVGGILAGAIAVPIAQHWSSSVFGPLDLVWMQLLGIALLGWVSAVIAAFVPAWIASRQDVVKVLAGRRGDRAPSKASPVVGAVLFAAGTALAVHGTRQPTWGEVWIAAAAVLVVLGGVLLLSPVVAIVGRLSGGAPLPLRYAVRDAARHRARTVPAIGAVMATVTGVVALGIANASDAKESEETYRPSAAMGSGSVRYWSDGFSEKTDAESWATITEVVRETFPEARAVQGFKQDDGAGGYTDINLKEEVGRASLLGEWGGSYSSWIVDDQLPAASYWMSDEAKAQADAALRAGKVVLFTDDTARLAAEEMDQAAPDTSITEATLVTSTWDGYSEQSDQGLKLTVPVTVVEAEFGVVQGILPTKVAERLDVPITPVSIEVPGPVSKDEAAALDKALQAAGVGDAEVYVERGWPGDRESALLLLILAAVGGLLMLGGTLTATFLALSDAAPDLATLSAVGAAPRERRLVAASYALVVGGIGSVLGALVGLVPGIAATWPMTGHGASWEQSHYLDIPWLLILGVVVGLPLLTALVVGLCARSRLPLVARID